MPLIGGIAIGGMAMGGMAIGGEADIARAIRDGTLPAPTARACLGGFSRRALPADGAHALAAFPGEPNHANKALQQSEKEGAR